MKLPTLHKKKITKLIKTEKRYTNKGRKLNFLNYFLLPNHNISSILSENKNKCESEYRRTQRCIYSLNNLKTKINEFNKSKRLFFHLNNNNNNYLNSFYCKSTNRKISNYSYNSIEQEVDKYNNCLKYIKKTLNSYKIKKEISSYLYSSPEKQTHFLNYLSGKLNTLNFNNIKKLNNNEINNDLKTTRKIKVMRRLINDENENVYDNNEIENDKDEDKTNLREYNLFSFTSKDKEKNIKCKKPKYIRNNVNKHIECWDNNLLKNILPQSLKIQYELNTYKYLIPKRGFTSLNLNSTNENVYVHKNKMENNSLKKNSLNNYFKRRHTIYLRRTNRTSRYLNNA